jgi:flagellar hook-associated protein 1 FlgK
MSLFGSIQMAGNTLQAMQIGLHVVGNNIANANTPGYIRERVLYTPAPTQKLGNLTLGLGVEVAGIVQSLDNFAEDRLRDLGSDRASAEIQEKTYFDLESILGELSDTDVSTSLSNFFSSVNLVLQQPEEMSVRTLAAQAGKTLSQTINNLNRRVETVYTDFGRQVDNLSNEINSLAEQVAKLNVQIVGLEAGDSKTSEAGGLRSQRMSALKRLAEIADIKATETPAGSVNVDINGDILVFEGTRREVRTTFGSNDDGLSTAAIEFVDNGSALQVAGGELHGIYEARDRIVSGFLDRLDEFAGTLANEFNKLYSQGQGATGYKSITSVESVTSSTASLDEAGLAFTPVHGKFDLLVYNTVTKLTETHTIDVNLLGLDGDSSLSSLAAAINAVDGVSASVTADNRLTLQADSSESRIAFSGDTSGVLASLGINTFFTGSTAKDIGVNSVVLADGTKFAAALDGIGVGTDNALRLVALHDAATSSTGGPSITGIYDQLINETTQGATVAGSIADGFRVFEQTLEAKAQATSGVNLDEEAIDMIMLQRTYQASAKYVATLSDLLDILVSL